jgi:hypothetical protein
VVLAAEFGEMRRGPVELGARGIEFLLLRGRGRIGLRGGDAGQGEANGGSEDNSAWNSFHGRFLGLGINRR